MNIFNFTETKIWFLIIALAIITGAAEKALSQDYSYRETLTNTGKAGNNILWEPGNVSQKDLFIGPGGKAMRPNLKKITFLKEEKGGSSKKFRIKDGDDNEWVVKVDHEAQPETASVRLLWALGYKTEINYLEPTLEIPGKGTYTNVRFEARPDKIEREGRWSWKKNPFSNTKELKGLLIMMAFLNNWDLKDEGNNIILESEVNGRKLNNYVISDLGATFGRTGYINFPIIWRFGRHINKPNEYLKSKFISGTDDGKVEFSYAGRNPGLLDDITIKDTYWITGLLSQLSDKQIRDAFRAANYTPNEIETLTTGVKNRIDELEKLRTQKRAE
ncbi:MAG: hypothetical protein R2681_13385 [Pyrinomonadaceae bacterium]